MAEAIDKEDWERMDKGLTPVKKPKVVIPEPKFPKIDNHLKFEDVPIDRFEKLLSARRSVVKNEEGARFIGYDVLIEFKGKRKPGRPPETKEEIPPEIISGWMIEGDFLHLYRLIRDRVNIAKIVW